MKKKNIFIVLTAFILGLSACGTSSNGKQSPSSINSGASTSEMNISASSQSGQQNSVSSSQVTEYTITYNLDGGTNASNNPTKYTAGTAITLSNPNRTGYTFSGWYDENNNKVTSITNTTTGNITLTAHWTAVKNSLTVTSEDTNKGTVAVTSGTGYSDESITVKATPVEEAYAFDGWYNGTKKVSDNATYTFTMPKSAYSLVAHFKKVGLTEEERATRLGTRPIVSSNGKTVTYGLYPQTNVNDSSLITALNKLTTPESNGWYLYNYDYYAKVNATPRASNYKFDNGTTIVNGTTYWFKCEPITWNVINKSSGEYYLTSSLLLDASYYHDSQTIRIINNFNVYPCDYEDSYIRSWLNNGFYNSAFALNHSYITVSDVDNSASENNCAGSLASNDTEDNVFLMSYSEMTDENYGFVTNTSSSTTRACKPTDWAKARGTYLSSTGNKTNACYWTRSPWGSTDGNYKVWYVDNDGRIGSSSVDYTGYCVRPCIHISSAQ